GRWRKVSPNTSSSTCLPRPAPAPRPKTLSRMPRPSSRRSIARPDNDPSLGAGFRLRPAARTGVDRRLARPPERIQLANDVAATAVFGGAGRLSVLLWHSVEPAGPAGGSPRNLCRVEEFRDQFP